MKTNLKSAAVLLLLPLGILYGGDARAQSGKLFSNPVPGKHDFAVEVGLLPGGGKIIDLGHFSSKFYLSDKYAVRFGVEFDIHRVNQVKTDDYDPRYGILSISERSDYWGFNAGIEKRFFPKSRISPYIGLDFVFGRKSAYGKYTDKVPYWDFYSGYQDDIEVTTVEGAIRYKEVTLIEGAGYYRYESFTYYGDFAYRSYGMNLIFGTDFYIMNHLYLGFEFGIGFKYQKFDGVEVSETSAKSNGTSTFQLPVSHTLSTGLNVNNALRVGIWF